MTKMAMLVYNEAIDDEMMETLDACGLKNYTKIKGVFGKGETSGAHLGDDVWPGRNNILYVSCAEGGAQKLLARVKELRKSLGREGVKVFIWSIEEIS
ncbi:MAG: hypothetical protein PHV40_02670 [Candidatus Omnitrophica bacterium]|nr:hypothetical protein [Candidatus Omnitrophota bacterium]